MTPHPMTCYATTGARLAALSSVDGDYAPPPSSALRCIAPDAARDGRGQGGMPAWS